MVGHLHGIARHVSTVVTRYVSTSATHACLNCIRTNPLVINWIVGYSKGRLTTYKYFQALRANPTHRISHHVAKGIWPRCEPNRITLRITTHRRVILPLVVVEQPTRIRRLLAREAQRQFERHTIPVRACTRNLVAEHLALVAPLPDRDIPYRIDHHARCAQMIRLPAQSAAHALLFSGFTRGSHRYLATGHTLQREDPAAVVAAIQSVSDTAK